MKPITEALEWAEGIEGDLCDALLALQRQIAECEEDGWGGAKDATALDGICRTLRSALRQVACLKFEAQGHNADEQAAEVSS